jgi:hypothetical protein
MSTVQIPRAEIQKIKSALVCSYKQDLAEGRRGPDNTYGELLRVLSHPAAVLRARMVPGTLLLQSVQNVLIILK